jgi:hypothetical protein
MPDSVASICLKSTLVMESNELVLVGDVLEIELCQDSPNNFCNSLTNDFTDSDLPASIEGLSALHIIQLVF